MKSKATPAQSDTARPERTIIEQIRHVMDDMTRSEKRLAHTLLADFPMSGLGTVATLAERAGVSGPTVLRMVGKLGFPGFGDFQGALRSELDARLKTPLMKYEHAPADSSPADEHILSTFAAAALDNLRQSFAETPRSDFEDIVDLLSNDRRAAHLIGGRFTGAMANYMANHLRIVRSNVHEVEGERQRRFDYLLDIGRQDVVVAFDVRRYQRDIVAFSEQAAAQGATILLYTDQWMSPIAKVARNILPVRIEAPSNWDSAIAMLGLVEATIAAVTNRLWEKSRERMQRIEDYHETL